MSSLPIREDLRDQQPYGAPQIAAPVSLNVNENPYPPSEALVTDAATAVAEVVRGLNRYPDREAVQLRADLARYLEQESGVTVETRQVWAANGSNEIMQQVLQAFGGPGRAVLSFSPTYSMYSEYARNTNTEYIAIPRADDFSIDRAAALEAIAAHRPSVIMLASPNNPTGTALDLDLISEIHAATDGIVVVDEAYAEFRRAGTESAATLVPSHRRLLVARTMSKAFAFAGARVGYAVAQIPVIDALRIVRLPYHLSATTQVLARVALAHADELQADVATLRTDRDALAEWLLWNGFEAPPSDANFIMFGQFADRGAVWQGLVDRGVLVREVGPPEWLRVSIGRPEEIAAFKSALLDVVRTLGDGEDSAIGPVAQRAVSADADGEPTSQNSTGPAPARETDAGAEDSEASVEAVGTKLQALREGVPTAVNDPAEDFDLLAAGGPDRAEDPSSGDSGGGDPEQRAAQHDEAVALAVLRDQAEAAADQLADPTADKESRA